MKDGPAEASSEDLRAGALKHYEELSAAACSWSSVIPQAINFYFDSEAQGSESGEREGSFDNVAYALKCLESDHVLKNKHRLGLLGSANIVSAIEVLKDELVLRAKEREQRLHHSLRPTPKPPKERTGER